MSKKENLSTNNLVKVKAKDFYQFLVEEMRYARTRNNHLMPCGAIEHLKEYLPKLKKVDEDLAFNTAKQIAEETNFDIAIIHFIYEPESVIDEYRNLVKYCVEFMKGCENVYNSGINNLDNFIKEFEERLKLNIDYKKLNSPKKYKVTWYIGSVEQIDKVLKTKVMTADKIFNVHFEKILPKTEKINKYFSSIGDNLNYITIDYGSWSRFIKIEKVGK